MNFVEMFYENYSCFLNEVNYKVVAVGDVRDKVDILINDNVSFELVGDSNLKVVVERKISFNPNIVYEIRVSFGAILTFRDGNNKLDNIDFEKEFITDANGSIIIQGLLSRISLQIAQITSSYGQNPLVTPPNLMN